MKKYQLEQDLKAVSYSNATILPCIDNGYLDMYRGGVFDDKGELIPSSTWHEGIHTAYDYYKKDAVERNEEVVYIGCLFDVWGHAITDNLKKLWWIQEKKENIKCVYITVGNKPVSKHVYEIFSLCGFDLTKAEHIIGPTVFKEVIVPNNSLVNCDEKRFYHQKFVDTINRIKSRLPETAVYDKIYFTRTQLRTNKDYGEKNIEKIFRKNGFEIIAPETIPVLEQLTLLANCKVFASTEGSVSHSSIFCQPGTNVIILKKVNFENAYTEFINEMSSLDAIEINAHKSIFASKEKPWNGPFYMYVTRDLANYFHNLFYIPYFFHFSWYRYMWNNVRIMNFIRQWFQ